MTRYEVKHRQRDDKWVIYSNGTPYRTYDRKRPAKQKARDLAKPGDTLTVYDMGGGVVRDYDNPRS